VKIAFIGKVYINKLQNARLAIDISIIKY